MSTDGFEKTTKWLQSLEYLPPFMRDFHDCKDVFKLLFGMAMKGKHAATVYEGANWIQMHVFVVDTFLWWMARRGWTLQRSRKRLEFMDAEADIAAFMDEYRKQCAADIQAAINSAS